MIVYSPKRELFAFAVVLLIVVGFPVAVFGYQYLYQPRSAGDVKVFDLTAQMPESGGWQPERLTVNQGDRVRLRLHGADVVHSFAIGRMDLEPVVVNPGEMETVEFVAEEAGQFTFYCNVWCSPFHYRMRGTLEVLSPDGSLPVEPPTATEQRLNELGTLVDEPHPAAFYPTATPSAEAGQFLAENYSEVLEAWRDVDKLRSTSPSDVFAALRTETPELTDEERWDLIAYLWSTATTPEQLAAGKRIYAKNCAACHAMTGTGDGPAWEHLQDEPQSFADATTMAGGTGWIYYAKTARGGMGTGMPYFGTLFTEEQTWSVVDYLWTFLFEYSLGVQ